MDLTETYRAGLRPHLAHARRVADPFHVTRVGKRIVDTVQRRVQKETLGTRAQGRSALTDRKLLIRGEERLDERRWNKLMVGLRLGDLHDEVLGGGWKEAFVPSISPTT